MDTNKSTRPAAPEAGQVLISGVAPTGAGTGSTVPVSAEETISIEGAASDSAGHAPGGPFVARTFAPDHAPTAVTRDALPALRGEACCRLG